MVPESLTLALEALALLALAASVPARPAAWWGWPAAMLLLPTMTRYFLPAGVVVEPRLLGTLILAPGLWAAWQSVPAARRGWRAVDWLVAVMVGCQMISFFRGGYSPLSVVQIPMTQFALPYVIGRIGLASVGEIGGWLRPLCLVTAALAVTSVFEFTTSINPYAVILRGPHVNVGRMGVGRVNGPMAHPLYLAMVLVLLMAPALEASARARRGAGPRWWRALPWLVVAAVLTTVSRGPMLTLVVALGAFAILGLRSGRVPLMAAWLAATALIFTQPDALRPVARMIEATNEDGAQGDAKILVIDGEEYIYTGMDHRSLVFKAYEKPLQRAGLFGYSPKLRGVQIDESLMNKFWTMDNHYVSHTLSYGYLGMGLFLAAQGLAALRLLPILKDPSDPRATLARGLFGVLVAWYAGLYGVQLRPDHGVVLMTTIGLAVNLTCLGPPAPPGAATSAGGRGAAIGAAGAAGRP
jgi:hypothetical protein